MDTQLVGNGEVVARARSAFGFQHGNLDTSAGPTEPGKPPGPVTSRAGGGAFVVVGARESRVHGEGRQ